MPRGPTHSLQSLALCRGYSDQVISPPVFSRPESQRRPARRQRSIHAQVCTPEHQSKHHRQAAKTISPPSICGLVCPRLRNVSCSNAPRTQVRPTTSHAGSHLWDSPSTLAHASLDGHRPQHRKTTRANQPTKINHQRRASSVRAIVKRRKGHAHVATALSVDNCQIPRAREVPKDTPRELHVQGSGPRHVRCQ